jgi:serine/threonine-protein kinase PBS1
MGCFSCFDSPTDEQLNPKLGGGPGPGGGYGGSSSSAAAYGAGTGAVGRHGDRGYPDLQQAAMVAPRVEKHSAGAFPGACWVGGSRRTVVGRRDRIRGGG